MKLRKALAFATFVAVAIVIMASCSGLVRKTVTIPTDIYSDESYDMNIIIDFTEETKENGITYKLTTLQVVGYAADKSGQVSVENTAPSERFNEVIFRSDGDFPDTPDLTDGVSIWMSMSTT